MVESEAAGRGAEHAPTSTAPAPPPPTLRERKKAAAMRHIQAVALDLFDRHGFDSVTIEQVAATAEASPSTVYRYFGTKERLVLQDEFDDRVLAIVRHQLAAGADPWQAAHVALDAISQEHFVEQAEQTRRRTRMWFEVPSLRAAAYLLIDETIEGYADAMAATGRWSRGDARVVASGLVWPLIASVRNWHEDGYARPWPVYLHRVVELLEPGGAEA